MLEIHKRNGYDLARVKTQADGGNALNNVEYRKHTMADL